MILNLLNSIIPGWQQEYKFHPERRWRFDYVHTQLKIAVEINGGAYSRGRHVRSMGFINDMEKLNQAQILGWKVLQYTPQQISQMMNDINIIIDRYKKEHE